MILRCPSFDQDSAACEISIWRNVRDGVHSYLNLVELQMLALVLDPELGAVVVLASRPGVYREKKATWCRRTNVAEADFATWKRLAVSLEAGVAKVGGIWMGSRRD